MRLFSRFITIHREDRAAAKIGRKNIAIARKQNMWRSGQTKQGGLLMKKEKRLPFSLRLFVFFCFFLESHDFIHKIEFRKRKYSLKGNVFNNRQCSYSSSCNSTNIRKEGRGRKRGREIKGSGVVT